MSDPSAERGWRNGETCGDHAGVEALVPHGYHEIGGTERYCTGEMDRIGAAKAVTSCATPPSARHLPTTRPDASISRTLPTPPQLPRPASRSAHGFVRGRGGRRNLGIRESTRQGGVAPVPERSCDVRPGSSRTSLTSALESK